MSCQVELEWTVSSAAQYYKKNYWVHYKSIPKKCHNFPICLFRNYPNLLCPMEKSYPSYLFKF